MRWVEITAGTPGSTVTVYTSLQPSDLLEASLHEEINRAWTLRLRLPFDHPGISALTPMARVDIGVLNAPSSYLVRYVGRVISIKEDTLQTITVDVESFSAALNDSVVPPFSFPDDFLTDPDYQQAAAFGNVVAYFVRWLETQHNAQVAPAQRVGLSTTVTDPNNYIGRRSDSYLSTADVIKTRLIGSSLGGFYSEGTYTTRPVIEYRSAPVSASREIKLGRDILSIDTLTDATDWYTDIVPVGADGLTISGLPNGAIDGDLTKSGDHITSTVRRRMCGDQVVARVVEWPDVTVAANLRDKAVAKIKDDQPTLDVRVSIIDRGWIEDGLALLRIGYAYPVTSEPHGLQAQPMLLSSITRDLLQPGRSTVTLGRLPRTQTAAVANLTIKEG